MTEFYNTTSQYNIIQYRIQMLKPIINWVQFLCQSRFGTARISNKLPPFFSHYFFGIVIRGKFYFESLFWMPKVVSFYEALFKKRVLMIVPGLDAGYELGGIQIEQG